VIRDGFRLLLVGALLLAGCGGDGGDGGSGDDGGGGSASADAETPPEEPVTIRMGWIPAVSHSEQLSLMSTNPELAPNLGTWYELEFTEFPGTSAIVQGLAAGSLDVGTVGSLTVANGLDQGADLVITGQYIQDREGWGQSIWLVRADSGIDGPDDLAGKTVATNQVGSYVDYVADAYIRDEGGLEANRDYDKVEIPFPQQMDALGSGQTDVGVFVPPFGPTALASGEYEQLFSAIDVQEELIVVLQAFTRGSSRRTRPRSRSSWRTSARCPTTWSTRRTTRPCWSPSWRPVGSPVRRPRRTCSPRTTTTGLPRERSSRSCSSPTGTSSTTRARSRRS
jgi:hypothetical protein